ncbi:VOC family protein [Phenylobacterium sp.]|uniref:VOC family protein n=1 Tax=Phenylobacterium sp. TaxID=1871053 RepID=UPI002F9559AD
MTLTPYAHVLAVRDLPATTRYFTEVLGFSRDWNDAGNWECLSRDGLRMMIGACPDAIPPAELGDHSYFAYVNVDDVDALAAEFEGRGALIRSRPADKPWGVREMAVATPEGHRMMFAQVLATQS